MTQFTRPSLCLFVLLLSPRAHAQNEEDFIPPPALPTEHTALSQHLGTPHQNTHRLSDNCHQYANQGWQLLVAPTSNELRLHSSDSTQIGDCLLTDMEIAGLISGNTQFSPTELRQLHPGQGFFLRYKRAQRWDPHISEKIAVKNRTSLFNHSCSALENTPLIANIPLLLGTTEPLTVTSKDHHTIVMQHCHFQQALLMIYQQGKWATINEGVIKAGQGFLLKYQRAISAKKVAQ